MSKKNAHSHKRDWNKKESGNSATSDGDVVLSKALSYLLRHGAPKENLKVFPGGYVNVEDIFKLPKFSKWTLENIEKVVKDNNKQRFTIRKDPETGILQICANQGHSFDVGVTELKHITSVEECPVAIHGTYTRFWDSIKKDGLKRMNRSHIHFAPGVPGDDEVISGMRTSAEIYIYVDIEKALADNIQFYQSKNNVILSPGNQDGILETKYFAKVLNFKTKQELKY